jgi:hypothetical protein
MPAGRHRWKSLGRRGLCGSVTKNGLLFVASRRKLSSALYKACGRKCPVCLDLPHRKISSGGAPTLATYPFERPGQGGWRRLWQSGERIVLEGRLLRCSIGAGANARSRHAQHLKRSGWIGWYLFSGTPGVILRDNKIWDVYHVIKR